MSAFLNQQLTNAGWDALSIALGGGRLTFYKMQAGQGTIANDEAIPAMTSLVTPICDIPISSYVIEGDGQITLFGNINSEDLTTGFTFRELGVFAAIEDPVVGKGGVPSGPNIQAMVQTPGTTGGPGGTPADRRHGGHVQLLQLLRGLRLYPGQRREHRCHQYRSGHN